MRRLLSTYQDLSFCKEYYPIRRFPYGVRTQFTDFEFSTENNVIGFTSPVISPVPAWPVLLTSYYHLTREIAACIVVLFEIAFPELHEKYSKAFDAAVWIVEDPGPFVGRSIIYKLLGKLGGSSTRIDMTLTVSR